jgi:LysM repeat protein
MAALTSPACASATHTVVAGETLSGIAAANGMATSDLAAFNGLDPESQVIEGTTIQVPAPGEYTPAAPTTSSTTSAAPASSGASHTVVDGDTLSAIAAANGVTTDALASANGISTDTLLTSGMTLQIPAATATTTATSTTSAAPAPGLGAIPSPWGDLYLEASAADAWNAMRQDSLTNYGQDLYPQGPLSAYRTSDQQAQLYDLFLSGQGAPANPPGLSSHQLGTSVDVATPEMRSIIDQIGAAYGWGKFEAPDEWWHVSYGG